MTTPDATLDGSCRLQIGVWGDRSCAALREHTHCRNCPVYVDSGRRLLDRPPSAAQIEDWQQRLTAKDLPADDARTAVVVFRIGTEWLALPTALLREVIDPVPAHRVPHRRDPRFAGLVNVRGELMIGQCLSTPELMSDGKLKLKEEWQWLCGDMSSGYSEVVEH